MREQNWNRDLMEQILTLLQFFQTNGIPFERAAGPEASELLVEHPEMRAAFEMIRFMNEIPGGFMIYRAEGEEEIVYANRGLLRMFRCDCWEQFRALTGGSFRGIVHPEELQAVEENIKKQVYASQFDLDYVGYRIIRSDGTVGWIEDYGHYVRGESVGDFFYVFLGDATERRERQINEQALSDQEQLRRLEVIKGLSINYESILYGELERNRLLPYRLSCRTERQFEEGFHMKELRWYLANYIETWVHPEDRELVREQTSPEYMRRRLAAEETYYLNYRVIYENELQYLQLRVVNVGEPGHVDQIVMGYRRVDEELQREIEQKQMLTDALESANLAIVAKNEFLSNMSHNMRTPLNAIFGFAALAKEKAHDSPSVVKYLERLEASSRQLLSLIDEVL